MRFLTSLLVTASLFLLAGSAFASGNDHGHEHGEASHGHAEDTHAVDTHAVHGAPPVNWTDMGYGDKDIHGAKLESGGEPMAPPLLLALLNFAIFAGLLYWKAGPALSKYLANRHDSIKGALQEAAKLQEEAREKLAQYSSRIADADAEVNALIAQIRKDAEIEREQIVADAKRQAELMRKDAEARIESDFLTARRRLEHEIIAKAAETTERLLSENTSAVDHNNLFSAFITDLKAGKGAEGVN